MCHVDETRQLQPDGRREWVVVPAYTASLDAALTLVPEGFVVRVCTYGDECEVIGEDHVHHSYWTRFFAGRALNVEADGIVKAAIGLCAAAIRARARGAE